MLLISDKLQIAENNGPDESFNPIIVGVESQVAGFSQEGPAVTAALTPPETEEGPRLAQSAGNHKLEQPDTAAQHSLEKLENIIPVRRPQKARKSFTSTPSKANKSDDCIVLD